MAFDAGTVKGTIDLDAAKFLAELGKIDKRLASVESEVVKADKGFANFGRTLAGIAAAVGAFVIGFAGIHAGMNLLKAGFNEATEQASEFEQVVQNLGVTLSLKLGGSVTGLVEDLKIFAQTIQDTTAHSDDMTLRVAQQLALFGVGRQDLQSYTKAVLDYASASGTDAAEAARRFGMTLDGTVGRLGEAIPALKGLTAEQLKSGQAFEVAGRQLAGYSESVANTTAGIQARLTNAANDLAKTAGVIINPFLDKLREAAIASLQDVTSLIEGNTGTLTEVVRNFALSMIDGVQSLANGFTSARLLIYDLLTTIQSVLPAAAGAFATLEASAQDFVVVLARGLNFIGEVSDSTLAEIVAKADELNTRSDALAETWREYATEVGNGRREIVAQGQAVQSVLAPALERARNAVKSVTEEAVKSKFSFDGIASHAVGASQSTIELANAAVKAQEELAAAAREAGNLEAAADGAASSLSDAVNGGGGGDGGGGGALRGQGGNMAGMGGSRSLGLGSAEESLATLQAEQLKMQLPGAGLAPGFVKAGQQNIINGVAAIAQAQVNRAFSDFTSDVLRELNAAGVFDPAQRERLLGARLDEAQRLGVLPPKNAVSAITHRSFT